MNILYEDNDICVCVKPQGILAQSNRSFDTDMVSLLKARYKISGSEPYIAVINRLDRPVSGIMLFARNKSAAAALTKQLTGHTINKQYYALCVGIPTPPKGDFNDYLLKDSKTNTSKIVKEGTKDAKLSKLSYELIDTYTVDNLNLSLVKIDLHTGRHHQIRVQFSGHNLPLLYDTKYNPLYNTVRSKGLVALCAYHLEFRHPVSGKPMSFSIQPDWDIIDTSIL